MTPAMDTEMRLLAADTPLPADALRLANTDDVGAFRDALGRAGVVALEFPKWTDGRAYSQAVVLRGRLRYAGEIRATGEVVLDMLPLLRRCGFDTAVLEAGQDLEAAERSFDYFPGHYQGDAVHRAPRFAPGEAAR
jgi:uncharacterized protein (DUF934 family)